jgi:fumarylacetoacetase
MALRYLVEAAKDSFFPVQNIPFGLCRLYNGKITPCTQIGNQMIDLGSLEKIGLFKDITHDALFHNQTSLEPFMSKNKKTWTLVRERIQQILKDETSLSVQSSLIASATMLLPIQITDFTDFTASISHAHNMGREVGFTENESLKENVRYIPNAYHSRASSVVLSGQGIRRPNGPVKTDKGVVVKPTSCMDFELEMGVFIGGEVNEMGRIIDVNSAEDVIFGLVLLNDWSARDIQHWEFKPLGYFASKNYATSISPWIITLDALEPFRKMIQPQDPLPPKYLRPKKLTAFDVDLELRLKTASLRVSESLIQTNLRNLYWSLNQLIAHHTVTGCPLRVGSLIGTGSCSGYEHWAYGSLQEWELTGNKPVLSNGEIREYLQDGDEVIIRGWATSKEVKIGFGELRNSILPALNLNV